MSPVIWSVVVNCFISGNERETKKKRRKKKTAQNSYEEKIDT